MERLNMEYVAIVESERSRSFHGPFDTPMEAALWMNAIYPDREKAMVEILHKPQKVSSTNSDQTTISDHIDDIHDHVS